MKKFNIILCALICTGLSAVLWSGKVAFSENKGLQQRADIKNEQNMGSAQLYAVSADRSRECPFLAAQKQEIMKKASSLQAPFIENMGQIKDGSVRFYAKTFGGTVFITREGEIVYSLPKFEKEKKVKGCVIKETLVGSSNCKVKGKDESETRVSYFKGNDSSKWKSNIPTYNLVSLGTIYNGIEMNLRAYGNNVEKLFYVSPGAKPEGIRVKIQGAEGLIVNEQGELELETELGAVKFTSPVAYQEVNNKKRYVEVAYAIKGDEYGFKVGDYDRTKMLVIDPLLASTFIGGNDSDTGYSIALDEDGNVYVTGYTYSDDYPTTPGAYDETYNGGHYDVFVSKLNSNLSSLLASTFIGGIDWDGGIWEEWGQGNLIVIDRDGNVYITGSTFSDDYPTTPGAYNETYNGWVDVFITKLDSNLSSLLASTFIGGNYEEYCYSIALDGDGNVYVTGWTQMYYPTTPGAYDETYNGIFSDVFVSKLDASLSSLLASTYIGGKSDEVGYSIALDEDGNVYVTGYTHSDDYPTTPGAYDETHNGYGDVFVSMLDTNLSSLLASTFIGRASVGTSIALDEDGHVYVTGSTRSPYYPTTPGAYDETYNGGSNVFLGGDVFVSKLNASLSSLLASTFIGGTSNDTGYSIVLDEDGNVYVTGWTDSDDYPTTPRFYDQSFNGDKDIFVSILDSGNLDILRQSTYIGGNDNDYGYSIACDVEGEVYVTGKTGSDDYPTTPGAYDETLNGCGDVFVSKLKAHDNHGCMKCHDSYPSSSPPHPIPSQISGE